MKSFLCAAGFAIAVQSLFLTACTSIPGAASAASAALAGGTNAPSNAPQANQAGDASMTCEQIKAEIDQMNGILGVAQGEVRAAEAIGLTKDLAINGALYSGALSAAGGSVPYLGTAMNMMNQANAKKKADTEARVTAAYNRRSVLTGMYAAKGCGS